MSDKPRGRPPLDSDDKSVPVCVRIPATQYDDLYTRATRQGISVPELIRREQQPKPDEKRYLK